MTKIVFMPTSSPHEGAMILRLALAGEPWRAGEKRRHMIAKARGDRRVVEIAFADRGLAIAFGKRCDIVIEADGLWRRALAVGALGRLGFALAALGSGRLALGALAAAVARPVFEVEFFVRDPRHRAERDVARDQLLDRRDRLTVLGCGQCERAALTPGP